MASEPSKRHLSVDALPCAAAYADANGLIVTANERFQALWASCGCEPHLADRPPLATLFADEERDALAALIATPRALARPATRDMRLAGSHRRILVECVPIVETRPRGIVWLLMLRPPRLAADARGQEESFRAAMQARVVHDLRDPLQVVLGWVSLLRRQHDDPRRVERALTIIERNAKLQMHLLQDLLELARHDARGGGARRARSHMQRQ